MTRHDDIEAVKRAADAQHHTRPRNPELVAPGEDHPLEDALKAAEGWSPFNAHPRPQRERDNLLAEAGRLISGDRERDYGSAVEDFTRTGKMWAAILGIEEVTAEQVAMCMTALKLGRLCNTPNHRDSWVDAIGYLALGGDISQMTGRYL